MDIKMILKKTALLSKCYFLLGLQKSFTCLCNHACMISNTTLILQDSSNVELPSLPDFAINWPSLFMINRIFVISADLASTVKARP